MSFVLPPKSQVGYLDPQIAGEGVAVDLSNGNNPGWTPPPQRLTFPDMSNIKSVQKYFNRDNSKLPNFPAWVFHKDTDEKRLVTEEQAFELGVIYRDRTPDEASRFGGGKVWDYRDDCPWRASPTAKHIKFDANRPGTGKIVVVPASGPSHDFSIDRIVAAVTAAMTATKAPAEENSVEKMAMAMALAFKSIGLGAKEEDDPADEINPKNALSDNNERDIWIEEAEQRGVKIDRRWSTERIKQAIAEAA